MFGNLSHADTLGMEIWGLENLQDVDQNVRPNREVSEVGFIKFTNSFSISIHHCEVEISEHLMYRTEFQIVSFPDWDLHLKRRLLCAIFSTLEEFDIYFFLLDLYFPCKEYQWHWFVDYCWLIKNLLFYLFLGGGGHYKNLKECSGEKLGFCANQSITTVHHGWLWWEAWAYANEIWLYTSCDWVIIGEPKLIRVGP